MEINMSPMTALQKLRNGNLAFMEGRSSPENLSCPDRRKQLAENGQNPFAVVITCADSRVPCESIFQTHLGDLFVIRVAGGCVDASVVASVEYAVSEFDCQVCVVMGHSECGAVKAALHALDDASTLSTPALQEVLKPLMTLIENDSVYRKFESKKSALSHAISSATSHQISTLKQKSSMIYERESSGLLKIIHANYNIATGAVEFSGEAV
jgi:carbonic anhydrase